MNQHSATAISSDGGSSVPSKGVKRSWAEMQTGDAGTSIRKIGYVSTGTQTDPDGVSSGMTESKSTQISSVPSGRTIFTSVLVPHIREDHRHPRDSRCAHITVKWTTGNDGKRNCLPFEGGKEGRFLEWRSGEGARLHAFWASAAGSAEAPGYWGDRLMDEAHIQIAARFSKTDPQIVYEHLPEADFQEFLGTLEENELSKAQSQVYWKALEETEKRSY